MSELSEGEKKEYEAFKYYYQTNTEKGISYIPDYMCENVLNLIEKQQKEIEELKEKNKKLQDRSKELIFEKQELTSALLDSTPNDKINAKIEEVDKDENASIPDIIESQIGRIITSQDYYRESLHSLDDYEYICNCCLEIFESNLKYKKSRYFSEKEIGEKVNSYLIELRDWITDVLEED